MRSAMRGEARPQLVMALWFGAAAVVAVAGVGRPAAANASGAPPWLGVELAEGTRGGIAVRGVIPRSPAEKANIRPGEEVLAVAGKRVATPRELVQAVSAAVVIHLVQGPHQIANVCAGQGTGHQRYWPDQRQRGGAQRQSDRATHRCASGYTAVAVAGANRFVMVAADGVAIMLTSRVHKKTAQTVGRHTAVNERLLGLCYLFLLVKPTGDDLAHGDSLRLE